MQIGSVNQVIWFTMTWDHVFEFDLRYCRAIFPTQKMVSSTKAFSHFVKIDPPSAEKTSAVGWDADTRTSLIVRALAHFARGRSEGLHLASLNSAEASRRVTRCPSCRRAKDANRPPSPAPTIRMFKGSDFRDIVKLRGHPTVNFYSTYLLRPYEASHG